MRRPKYNTGMRWLWFLMRPPQTCQATISQKSFNWNLFRKLLQELLLPCFSMSVIHFQPFPWPTPTQLVRGVLALSVRRNIFVGQLVLWRDTSTQQQWFGHPLQELSWKKIWSGNVAALKPSPLGIFLIKRCGRQRSKVSFYNRT